MMEREKLEAIKQWTNDPCGAVYSDKYAESSREFYEATINNRYVSYAPWLKKLIDGVDCKGKTVLELGCGIGVDLLEFAKNGADVTGLDLTPKHLDLAKKLFEVYGYQARFIQGDAESIELPPASVDIVYSFGVLHHTPNIDKAIAEIHRVLKPGGLAIVGLYHKNSWHYWVNIFLNLGIIKRKLSQMPMNELLSSSIEISHSDARPLVKLYTSAVCRKLFKGFASVKIKRKHWSKDQISIPWTLSYLVVFLPRFLPSILGWYIIVFARKE